MTANEEVRLWQKKEDDKMMKMKKSIVLTVLFMFVLSAVCMANPMESGKWELIGSNAEVAVYYDAQTIKHYDGGAFCNVDVMMILPAEGKCLITNSEYSKGMTVKILSFREYSLETGELIGSGDDPNAEEHDIPAGSLFEVIWEHVM